MAKEEYINCESFNTTVDPDLVIFDRAVEEFKQEAK